MGFIIQKTFSIIQIPKVEKAKIEKQIENPINCSCQPRTYTGTWLDPFATADALRQRTSVENDCQKNTVVSGENIVYSCGIGQGISEKLRDHFKSYLTL